MAKGIWRRQGDHAVPVGAASVEYFSAIKDGAEFIADTHGARNLKQLKMWWVLCQLLADNHHYYQDRESASKGLKLAIGCVDTLIDHTGKLHFWPRSIALESMTQEDFNPLFKRAIDKVAEWLGAAPADVQRQFNEIVADKRYEGYRR